MRTVSDRIRHALSFEIIGLLLAVPFGALVFDHPMQDIGVITIVSSIVATVWNYLYNWGFDHALQRLTGSVAKTLSVRVGHAVLFEAGLVALLMPFVAWYLGIGIVEALLLDVSLAIFYMVYAFIFNWAYDRVFPVPGEGKRAH